MSGLGSSGTLTIGSVVQYVRDLRLTMGASEVDDTTRANQGWRSRKAGLRQWGATFDVVIKSGDTLFKTLQTAFVNGTSVTATIADFAGNSVSGACSITQFDRDEPLDDIVTVSVGLTGNGKPTVV